MDLGSDFEDNGTACHVADPQVPEAVNIIQALAVVVSAIVSAPINIYLFIIIIKYPSLHQRSLYLPIQIIGVEILYHLTIPITILVSTINDGWLFGSIACNITVVINDGFAMFRFGMTLVLTFDRFLSVYKPFFYQRHGAIISWTHTALMWMIALVRVLVQSGWVLDCVKYLPGFKTCTLFPGCSSSCTYFAWWSFSTLVLTGIVLPLILYIMILFITCRIIKYQKAIQASVTTETGGKLRNKDEARKYPNTMNNKVKFFTLSILLNSIVGATPAVILYLASTFYPGREIITILNRLVGRTIFNFIPLFDATAFHRHQDVRRVTKTILKQVKDRLFQRKKLMSRLRR